MTDILLLGGISKNYHKISKLGAIFVDFLTQVGYSVKISENMDQLLPSNIKNYKIIIDYTTHQSITKLQEDSLLSAIKENSILYIGLHSATTSYKESEEMMGLIGARFIKHPPIRKILVSVEDNDHPILTNISDFIIKDELYLQEYFPPFQTLLSTQFKSKKIPLSWIKPYGKGLVFYLALGHGNSQLTHKCVQQLIKNVIHFWYSQRR